MNALQSLAFPHLPTAPFAMEAVGESEQKKNKHRHKHTAKETENTQRKKGNRREQRGAEYPSPPAQGTGRGSTYEMTQMQERVQLNETSSESEERASLVAQSSTCTTPAAGVFPCLPASEETRSTSRAVNFSSVAVSSNNYRYFCLNDKSPFLPPGFKYTRHLIPFFYMTPSSIVSFLWFFLPTAAVILALHFRFVHFLLFFLEFFSNSFLTISWN